MGGLGGRGWGEWGGNGLLGDLEPHGDDIRYCCVT